MGFVDLYRMIMGWWSSPPLPHIASATFMMAKRSATFTMEKRSATFTMAKRSAQFTLTK